MDQISIASIIFVSFPEALLVSVLSIILLGKSAFLRQRDNLIRVLVYAVLSSILSYFVRRNVANEIESLLVHFILTSLLFIFIIRFKFYESIMAALFGLITIAVVETLCLLSLSVITGFKIDDAYMSDITRILISLPERIVQAVLIYLSLRFNWKIIDLESTAVKKKDFYIQLGVYIVSIGTLVYLAVVMGKMLLFDHGYIMNTTNTMLLRLNIYLSLFVTVVLTLAIRNTHEFYKNKTTLSNNELLQNLEYISNLIQEKNIPEAKGAVESLKSHISKQ